MNDIVSNNSLYFAGGALSGIIFTIFWFKLFSTNNGDVKRNKDDEIEHEYAPGAYNGKNKLMLVVRNDLKMGKGKAAAQCSHAAVLAHESCRKKLPDVFAEWKRNGQPKIVVKIDNEEEMMQLAGRAKKLGVLVSIVQDAGRTQVAPGSRTVLALGPASEDLLGEFTSHLKLY